MPNQPARTQLDSIDRAILEVLQLDGRLSNVDLAQQVHLSPSACLRRVKQLEESGVIAQYVALLNPRSDVERLYFTTDATWKDVKTCGGCEPDSTIPCRQFVELPIEDYA